MKQDLIPPIRFERSYADAMYARYRTAKLHFSRASLLRNDRMRVSTRRRLFGEDRRAAVRLIPRVLAIALLVRRPIQNRLESGIIQQPELCERSPCSTNTCNRRRIPPSATELPAGRP